MDHFVQLASPPLINTDFKEINHIANFVGAMKFKSIQVCLHFGLLEKSGGAHHQI